LAPVSSDVISSFLIVARAAELQPTSHTIPGKPVATVLDS